MELPLKTSRIIVQGSISSMTNMTDMSASSNVTATTTTEFLLGEFMVHNVAAWVNLAILMLGLITNPLILIVLRKKKIGSECSLVLHIKQIDTIFAMFV